MAKTTPPLTAQERVILFCTATGASHAAVGITTHAMQSMAIKGFIVHDRESGAYALTDSGRGIGTSRTSGDVRRESAKWAKADIDQIALSPSLPGRDRMGHNRPPADDAESGPPHRRQTSFDFR